MFSLVVFLLSLISSNGIQSNDDRLSILLETLFEVVVELSRSYSGLSREPKTEVKVSLKVRRENQTA